MREAVIVGNNPRVFHKADYNGVEEVTVISQLQPVLDALLIERPLWSFQLRNIGWDGGAMDITVLENGEELGRIGRGYRGHLPMFEIRCPRLAEEKRETARRSNRKVDTSMYTKKASTAIKAAKKYFARETVQEQMTKARQMAQQVMTECVDRKEREYYHADRSITHELLKWAQSEGKPLFLKYAEEHKLSAINDIADAERFLGEARGMRSVTSQAKNNDGVLVVRKDSGYILHSANGVQVVTDSDLTDSMRAKLGMLKLVEDKTFVTEMGFKLDEKTFMIVGETQ